MYNKKVKSNLKEMDEKDPERIEWRKGVETS